MYDISVVDDIWRLDCMRLLCQMNLWTNVYHRCAVAVISQRQDMFLRMSRTEWLVQSAPLRFLSLSVNILCI